MAQAKLPIKDILAAIDMNAKSVWKELSYEERKTVQFWLLNRYISAVQGSREEMELAVFKTNEYYNKHFNTIGVGRENGHQELMWQLLCISGAWGKIKFHPYIGFKTDTLSLDKQKQHYRKKLRELYPSAKSVDIDSYVIIESNENIKQLILDHGMEI